MLKGIFNSISEAYRYLTLFGGIVLLSHGILFQDMGYDPLPLRIAISGLLILIFPLSHLSKFVLQNIRTITTIVVGLIIVWVLFLLFKNELDVRYYTAYLLLNFTILFAINTRYGLFALIGVSLTGFVIVILSVESPRIDPSYAFSTAVPALVICGIAIMARLNSLKRKYEKSNFINYSAVGASRDGILLVDPKGNFIQGNRIFCDYMSIPPEYIARNKKPEAQAIALKQVKDPDRLVRLLESPQKESEPEGAEEFEMKSGVILEISYITVWRNHELMGRMWFFKDITQRKKYEAELIAAERHARDRNEAITELASHPSLKRGEQDIYFEAVARSIGGLLHIDAVTIWFFDPQHKSMVSRKHYHVAEDRFETGASITSDQYQAYFNEILHKRILVISDTRKHPLGHDFFEGHHTGKALSLCHAQIRSGDDLIGVLAVESTHSHTWSVEDRGYIGSVADLIALSIEQGRRRKIGERMERFNAILTATFELSETGILVVNKDQKALHYNELYMRIWNMDAEFIETADYETKMKHILGQVKERENKHNEVKSLSGKPRGELAGIIEFKDGRVVERYSKAIDLGEGQLGRVWFYLDVTDRTRKEQELIERNFELDSFVYRASHDLKAPLNSIMGLIEIIREEDQLIPILQYISLMDKSVKKLDSFIRQLTQFSQDARLKVVRKPIVIKELAEEIWRDLGFMQYADRVRFHVESNQTGIFYGDPVRLNIVLNNLISNAVKYQDLKKPTTEVEVKVEMNGKSASISVSDNGLGIPEDHLPRVFDLFFRASVQASGTGLGLYITRNATEKMGGRMEVESEAGKGSTFRLTIPNRVEEEVLS